ncbi:MAG: PhzF family phenazine biosynthesis protein [Bacteroidales bacterium]|nr:PhzF family phenazine biosynthesis protein [Bacteroidales bacterium]
MGQIKYFTVDVFTSDRFGGNQLAVFPDATKIPENLLQKIAREFNFSETTFVYPPENKSNDCKVRIFTPGMEIPMAGHPTIGTAYILLSKDVVKPKQDHYLMIEEKVGDIRVDFLEDKNGFHSITMSQPLPVFGPVEKDYKLIAGILSVPSDEINLQYPIQSVSCGNNFLFVPLKTLKAMHLIEIRNELLKAAKLQLDTTEMFVFTEETIHSASQFHCRMFAPLFGIYEDPATGSAAGPFGCYLLKNKINSKFPVLLEQGFEMGRPSILTIDIENTNGEITAVKVSGDVVLVSEGNLFI